MLRAILPVFVGLLVPFVTLQFLLQILKLSGPFHMLWSWGALLAFVTVVAYLLVHYPHRARDFITMVCQYFPVSAMGALLIVIFYRAVVLAPENTVAFMTFALLEVMCIFGLFAGQDDLRRMAKMIFLYSGSALADLFIKYDRFFVARYAIFPFIFSVFLLLLEVEPGILWGCLGFPGCGGTQTGVCYRRLRSGLQSPAEVVALCKRNNIRRMRIYDPHQPTLAALEGSEIELMLGVPNTDLQNLAADEDNAKKWVKTYVIRYSGVRFRYIAVGNEVSPIIIDTAQYKDFLLPAMQNISKAISAVGLENKIKVSTAIETGLLGKNYPPSEGKFRHDVQSFINPIVKFLASNRAPLLVNVYPYSEHAGNPRGFSLHHALFTSYRMFTPDGVRYQNLFDILVDATYSALEKAGGSSVDVVVSESGWPSTGGEATSIRNAMTYNNSLIGHVAGGSGTPKRPQRNIEAYVFTLFDDDDREKNPEYKSHFGLFLPDGQPKYHIIFR